MIELKWKCEQLRLSIDADPRLQKYPPMLPITAVTARIEQLVCKDKLVQLDCELKYEYKGIFEPIPHTDLLPTNYTTHIKLKDAEKKVYPAHICVPINLKKHLLP